jgi:hypothetical protein
MKWFAMYGLDIIRHVCLLVSADLRFEVTKVAIHGLDINTPKAYMGHIFLSFLLYLQFVVDRVSIYG